MAERCLVCEKALRKGQPVERPFKGAGPMDRPVHVKCAEQVRREADEGGDDS